MGIQRVFSGPEHVTCLAPDGLAHEFAAAAEPWRVSGSRHWSPRAEDSLHIAAFPHRWSQGWINRRGAECDPDHTHGFAHH